MREKINEVKEIFVKNDSNVIIDVSKKRDFGVCQSPNNRTRK